MGGFQHVFDGATGYSATVSIRIQQGGTEGWLPLTNADRTQLPLPLICEAFRIKSGVIQTLGFV